MARPFFTVGHSTRSTDGFLDLLRETEVQLVVDVRRTPGSRTNPQFNSEVLASSLSSVGIDYEHLAALGGLRGRKRDVSADVNGFWENRSFHNYADYALSDEFQSALTTLRRLGHDRRSAIMCAEAVWWRCHRRIIADYLIASGETVFHILGHGHVDPARITERAKVGSGGIISYPAAC
jgi:uncharacterized protein (DUF488 family)